ncbi:unnamed protein product, partial [Mesorhabditis spiculigera]
MYASGNPIFLDPNYHEQEIFLRSTALPRAISSAQADMSGFFPNLGNGSLPAPSYRGRIPIHTFPVKTDPAFVPSCPNYDIKQQEYIDSMRSEVMRKFGHLIDLIYNKTGLNVTLNSFDPYNIYDLLHIQRDIYHLTVPDWVTPQVMYDLKQFSIWRISTMVGFGSPPSTEIVRFKGEMLKEILQRFEDKLACLQNPQTPDANCSFLGPLKFYAYSSHDTTVCSVLASLGSYPAIPGKD